MQEGASGSKFVEFPLIQLLRKFKEEIKNGDENCRGRVSINSTSSEVQRCGLVSTNTPLTIVSINSTSSEVQSEKAIADGTATGFPLIQLLRKFKAGRTAFAVRGLHLVSINSTSSEVQSASF